MVGIAIAAILILIAGIVFFMAEPAEKSSPKDRSFSTIQSDISNGATFLDVRTPEEYSASHFDGAKNHSLQLLEAGTMPEINKADTVYVYCQSGNRSAQAANILSNAGYTVIDLGGLRDVESIGGNLQKG